MVVNKELRRIISASILAGILTFMPNIGSQTAHAGIFGIIKDLGKVYKDTEDIKKGSTNTNPIIVANEHFQRGYTFYNNKEWVGSSYRLFYKSNRIISGF